VSLDQGASQTALRKISVREELATIRVERFYPHLSDSIVLFPHGGKAPPIRKGGGKVKKKLSHKTEYYEIERQGGKKVLLRESYRGRKFPLHI